MRDQSMNLLSSIIYEEIFGKARIQLITESKPHWDSELAAFWQGDLDEVIRDYMTADALDALGYAEQAVADAMRENRSALNGMQDLIALTRETARMYKLTENQRLWQWE